MSRTYNKVVRCNHCTGTNTEWYRERNRMQRNHNRQQLRKIRKMFIEDFDNNVNFMKLPKTDDWMEPTDGHYIVTKRDLENYKCILRDDNDILYRNDEFVESLKRKLKPYDRRR